MAVISGCTVPSLQPRRPIMGLHSCRPSRRRVMVSVSLPSSLASCSQSFFSAGPWEGGGQRKATSQRGAHTSTNAYTAAHDNFFSTWPAQQRQVSMSAYCTVQLCNTPCLKTHKYQEGYSNTEHATHQDHAIPSPPVAGTRAVGGPAGGWSLEGHPWP